MVYFLFSVFCWGCWGVQCFGVGQRFVNLFPRAFLKTHIICSKLFEILTVPYFEL